MADETQAANESASSTETATAATPADTATLPPEEEKKPEKLRQSVEIKDIGPCKKHIKVSVERADIDELLNQKYKELMLEQPAVVPGFRPGKAPRKIVVRKYHKEVSDQVKGQVLMASLEQLSEENDVAPLSAPKFNMESLEIPSEGNFIYEFDVEVRPEFDVPNYKGLNLKRPVKQFSDADVAKEENRILSEMGHLIPKDDGTAQLGDFVEVTMTTKYQDKVIGSAKGITVKVDDRLAFKDGVAEKFGEQMLGASAGQTRTVDITLSDAVAEPGLRGEKVQAVLDIKAVKKLEVPEVTDAFLHRCGVQNLEQFHEKVRGMLESRLEYHQRQAARQQVLEQITAAATWELPRDLLQRQAKKALARRVMEMQEAGMGEDEIKARRRILEQDVVASTMQTLKEHFVLQKIAETEKIEASEDDIEREIERIADQTNQSARRVRAQVEKEDLLDALYAQITERKVLNLILESAVFEDVPLEPEKGVGTVEEQAVPGEMADPTAPPPEEKPETPAASA